MCIWSSCIAPIRLNGESDRDFVNLDFREEDTWNRKIKRQKKGNGGRFLEKI